ncbi:MAG: hypothetical protein JW841_12975 [Deltaproteobacteria bacterium]|nr:hypothetical protein [Deltaproteobacteria bacterium]
MKRLAINQLTLILSLLFAFSACGSEDKSSPASNAITSVPAETQISELTQEQQEQITLEVVKYINANITPAKQQKINCLDEGFTVGFFAGLSASACQSTYNECMSQDSEIEPFTEEDFQPDEGAMEQCQATVSQINKCLQEQVQSFNKMVDSASCNDLNNLESNSEKYEMSAPTCDTVAEICPDVVPEDEFGESSEMEMEITF